MSYSYSFPAPHAQGLPSPHHDNGQENRKASASDYDTFIKLLVTQMKNQDPTEPVDATQYVAQLASFSAVEQAVQTNAKLEAMLSNQAVQYVGKHLSTEDGNVSGVVKSVSIYVDGLIATLDNGEKLLIGPGLRISESEPKAAEATGKTDKADKAAGKTDKTDEVKQA